MKANQQFQREGELPDRDRELVILQTACQNRSSYEWSHHCLVAKAVGLSDTEIDRIGYGLVREGWSEFDHALLTAVHEIRSESTFSDTTWWRLADRYNHRQLLELIFRTGTYRTVSTMLRACRVPLDDWVEAVPLPPIEPAAAS